jgi:pimeloyl-ACP methyl ester carboxylesterase
MKFVYLGANAKSHWQKEPVVIIGGLLSAPTDFSCAQKALAGPLFRRKSFVANISRGDWWKAKTNNYQPHLLAVDKVVEQARRATGSDKVWLMCHSAGGVMARLWMGIEPFGPHAFGGFEKVRGVIFLGTPYRSEETRLKPSLDFATQFYPGAYHPNIKYVSLIGKAVQGRPFRTGSIEEWIAYRSYRVLHPHHPQQWGDGIITVSSAHIPGADNYVLPGIYHVPVLGKPSYSAPSALAIWSRYLNRTEEGQAVAA